MITSTEITPEFTRVLKIFTPDITEGRLNENPFQPELTSLDFGLYEDGRFRYTVENDKTVYERLTASFDENENKIIKTEKMIIVDLPLLALSLVIEKDTDLEGALKLIKSYDHYTGAIDDGAQYRDANNSNKRKLKDLLAMGVKEIIWKDITLMFSTPQDLRFNLVKINEGK